MKVHIYYPLKKGPWGGGNQFLRGLQKEFVRTQNYVGTPEEADVILFNSHHNLGGILKLKKKFSEKIFVHRVDGPLFETRGGIRNKALDKLIFLFSEKIASVTVMQSDWSRQRSVKLGYRIKKSDTIIYNAPDNSIFNKNNKLVFSKDRKVRLISTSWSANMRKGFDVYKYLDENLDFDKYEFVFVGNTPINFSNIKMIKPLSTEELAGELKKSDIFITASRHDPCSNSLIEALSCGLPAVVYDDGGHPELLKRGGEIFKNKGELIGKIDRIIQDYEKYQELLPVFSLAKTAEQYLTMMNKIDIRNTSNLSILSYFWLRLGVALIKFI